MIREIKLLKLSTIIIVEMDVHTHCKYQNPDRNPAMVFLCRQVIIMSNRPQVLSTHLCNIHANMLFRHPAFSISIGPNHITINKCVNLGEWQLKPMKNNSLPIHLLSLSPFYSLLPATHPPGDHMAGTRHLKHHFSSQHVHSAVSGTEEPISLWTLSCTIQTGTLNNMCVLQN